MNNSLPSEVDEMVAQLEGVTSSAVKLAERFKRMEGALMTARAAFQRYAVIHREKETEEGDVKAKANVDLANLMNGALKDSGEEEFAHTSMRDLYDAMGGSE